jgi:hypothetical protein
MRSSAAVPGYPVKVLGLPITALKAFIFFIFLRVV